MAPPQPGVLDLTDDLLEAVLLHLPSSERARCAPVCCRLAQPTAGSQLLWREPAVAHDSDDPQPGPMAHLLPFPALGRHVRSLTLTWAWGAPSSWRRSCRVRAALPTWHLLMTAAPPALRC